MSQLINNKSGNTRADDYVKDGVPPVQMGYLKIECTWMKAIKGIEPVPASETDRCAGIFPSSTEIELMMDSLPLFKE